MAAACELLNFRKKKLTLMTDKTSIRVFRVSETLSAVNVLEQRQ
jgi:hypothetical protein